MLAWDPGWTWISAITSRLSMTIKEYEGWAVEINAMHMIGRPRCWIYDKQKECSTRQIKWRLTLEYVWKQGCGGKEEGRGDGPICTELGHRVIGPV